MPLLDFGSDSNDILWMGEAIHRKEVKEGEYCEVRAIVRTGDSRGFLLECDYQGITIFDYAWRKGKTGQSLAAMFDDPESADDNHLFCKAQSKVKNAVMKAEEAKGCSWELSTTGDREVLTFRPKTGSSTGSKTPSKPNKPSEQSESLATLTAA